MPLDYSDYYSISNYAKIGSIISIESVFFQRL